MKAFLEIRKEYADIDCHREVLVSWAALPNLPTWSPPSLWPKTWGTQGTSEAGWTALAVPIISATVATAGNSVLESHPLALQTHLQSSECPHSSSNQTTTSAVPSRPCPVFPNIFTQRSFPWGPDRVFVTCHAQRCRAVASVMTVDLDANLLKSIHRPAVVFALKLNNYKFIPWKAP